MKENLIVTHTNASNSSNPLVEIPAALSKGSLSVTPAPPPSSSNLQITAHTKSARNSSPLIRYSKMTFWHRFSVLFDNNFIQMIIIISIHRYIRQPSMSGGNSRASVNAIPPTRSSLPGGATLTPGKTISSFLEKLRFVHKLYMIN